MAIAHLYRIVNCKTCGSQIDVEYLGPTVNVRLAGTISNPGQIRCAHCNESHKYNQLDLQLYVRQSAPLRMRQ
jgi:hypothetical protein